MTEKELIPVIIDQRERKLIELLENKENKLIDVIVHQLDVADIVISEKIGIERKEGFDYVASLIDNRLFEQIIRLMDAYETPILILEGLNEFVFQNVGLKSSSIYGSLSKISYKLGVSVIPTVNLEHTAIVIERIAHQERKKSEDKGIIPRSTPKKLNLIERKYYFIEGLIDCGAKKAKLLVDHFGSVDAVINAIKTTKITYTKAGKPKGISGPLEQLSGFGHKFVEKNNELLTHDTLEILSAKKKNEKKRKFVQTSLP